MWLGHVGRLAGTMAAMGGAIGSGTNKPTTTGKVTTAARRLFTALLPSFITESVCASSCSGSSPGDQRRRRPKLHATSSTAYLDGLRGLAACSVFAYHYTDYNHKYMLPFYGYNTEKFVESSSFMQLPYVRLLYSGTPMVHVFFVISGFALSLRPLGYLYPPQDGIGHDDATRATGQAKAQALIASSAFRRPIRLFIPPLGATFLAAFVVFVLGWMPTFMKPEESLRAQIGDWVYDAVYRVMWPWNWDEGSPHSRYNPHLWTIPMEFVHSMFLFLVLLVLSRLKGAGTRQIVLGLLLGYTLLIGRWAAFEFLGGAFLADLHLGVHPKATNLKMILSGGLDGDSKTGKRTRSFGALKKVLQIVVLLASGYVLSWPARTADMTPTFDWVQGLAPRSYGGGEKGKSFWLALAAFGAVWAVGRIQFVKNWILMSRFAQYTGKISFCFYIFQHLILNLMQAHVLGKEHKPATDTKEEEIGWGVKGMFGISSTLQRTVTWWAGLLIMGMALVCLADFGTRFLDGPAVRLAKRAEVLAFGVPLPAQEYIPLETMGSREGNEERLEK